MDNSVKIDPEETPFSIAGLQELLQHQGHLGHPDYADDETGGFAHDEDECHSECTDACCQSVHASDAKKLGERVQDERQVDMGDRKG